MRRKRMKIHHRLRATQTHGYGAKKKHRGGGSRAGRGMAGTGKRADQKKMRINPSEYFGKTGFKPVERKPQKGINVSDLDVMLPRLASKKLVEEKGGIYEVNLSKLGYDKLLGSGSIKSKLKVKVKFASKSAVDKVQEAGGSVELA